MERTLDLAGTSVGVLGILICLVAGAVRLTGKYHVLGYEAITLFIAGIALIVAGCFVKLHLLTMTR